MLNFRKLLTFLNQPVLEGKSLEERGFIDKYVAVRPKSRINRHCFVHIVLKREEKVTVCFGKRKKM